VEGILEGHPKWDGRKKNVVVTNTSERSIELRALVSAKDSDDLWDLRCEVREKLMTLLPTNAVRAAAYPAWDADGPAPTNTEFTRETYEAIRAANHPVICLKLPSASQRCVAADPATKQIKVFSRG
ncbi:MAG: hypothetical protein RL186_662, partial [Pseudomonadota bacterium]